MNVPTVEKIGGTSMSRFEELADALFFDEAKRAVYGRVFVVSAYGGMTDLLLEHKHSGEPGVFSLFSDGDDADEWLDRLTDVADRMCAINAALFGERKARVRADRFVEERVADARQCLTDVRRICSFGQFDLASYLSRVRELLSSMGEAHSAFNTAVLLEQRGVNARFVDLTGWRDNRSLSLEDRIQEGFAGVDLDRELPIVTGYAQCTGGMVERFGRGYSELTMSRIAVLVGAREAIIHKEYHLSSADPRIVGEQRSVPIGRTNYDVADQLANLGMEAIHPGAAKALRKRGIPLRIKHAFEPTHSGTLIDCDYRSASARVEIITGRRGVLAIEVFDHDMIGQQMQFESKIIAALERFKLRPIGKDLNANSITVYVACPLREAKRLTSRLGDEFPNAVIESRRVAFVCAIGTDMDLPGILARCSAALDDERISILSASQPLRGVDARFVVEDDCYAAAVKALHKSLIETEEAVGLAA